MSAPIIAYQLSLLGDAPKPGRGWQRPFYTWRIGSIPFPLSEDEERQCRMLRPDSMPPLPSPPEPQ